MYAPPTYPPLNARIDILQAEKEAQKIVQKGVVPHVQLYKYLTDPFIARECWSLLPHRAERRLIPL